MKHHDLDSPNCLSVSLDDLRRVLEARRDELIKNYTRLEEIAVGRVPDLADQVVAATVRDLAAEQMEQTAFLLQQVWDALDRIAHGVYGKCLNCGEPVCAKGLVALPWAVLCPPCQQVMDPQTAGKHPTIFHAA